MDPPPPVTSTPAGSAIRPLWSQPLPHAPRGLCLAREKGWTLAWDDKDWLYLLNHSGQRQAQVRMAAPVVAACCAEDGSAYAAGGNRGEVWWLAPDLMVRWERTVGQRVVAAAMDPFGQYLGISDVRGRLHVFDRHGKTVCRVDSPRPLHHLAFVPAAPLILGSSDYGLVAAFDLAGRLVWRDGPVAHIGSLAVSGDGEHIVLACFTEGLQNYSRAGKNGGRSSLGEPCRLAALSFDGRHTLVAGLGNRLMLLHPDGATRSLHLLPRQAGAIALGALADIAVVAVAEGPILGLDLREAVRPV